MVRVDGQESQAVVTTVDTEIKGTRGTLYLDLDAPISEGEHWRSGQRRHVEAKWKPTFIPLPIHRSLIDIVGSCSVQGSFTVQTYTCERRLYVLLRSEGEVKPLHNGWLH